MHSRQCSGTRTLLRLGGAGAVATFRTRKDSAGGDDQDVAIRELLLKLAGDAKKTSVKGITNYSRLRDYTVAESGASLRVTVQGQR